MNALQKCVLSTLGTRFSARLGTQSAMLVTHTGQTRRAPDEENAIRQFRRLVTLSAAFGCVARCPSEPGRPTTARA
jgi:hypothetical protein